MRIGWTSNAPWSPTGYGTQTAEVVPRMERDGHKVAVMANYGLAGTTIIWNGIQVMGQGAEAYSNDLTPSQIANWIGEDNVGIGISLYDVWVYKSPVWDNIPMLCWTPVDHEMPPVQVYEWFTRGTDIGRWAVAMTNHGKEALIRSGIDKERVFYAPHSFSGDIFKPTESKMRAEMNVPEDAHLTMINSANKGLTPIRKCWPEMLIAWTEFAKAHKDAYLYIHSEVYGIFNGVNILRLLHAIDAPLDRVKIVPQFEMRQGLAQSVLADLYSTSDVLLMTSRGEGFGIPAIEAQACGTPIIVTNFTAQPELVGSGWVVEGKREWDEFQTGWWKVPEVDGIIEALNRSYDLKGKTKEYRLARKKAVEFAKKYETDYVYKTHWKKILKQIEGYQPKMRRA